MTENEQGSAGGNADVVAQFGGFGADAVAIDKSAVLGFQVVEQIFSGFADDDKVPAGKGLVLDYDVGGVITANGKRLISKLPTLGCCTVIIQ